ncbi:MAG: hypothetical protein AAF721_04330 [Myxococcota bacterium]
MGWRWGSERGAARLGAVAVGAAALVACSSGAGQAGSGQGIADDDDGESGATGWGVVPTGSGSTGSASSGSLDTTGSAEATADAESGAATSTSGTTGAASCANWITPLSLSSGEAREFEVAADDTLLGVAFTDDGALLFALDRCDGTLLHETLASDDPDLALGDVVVDGARMIASGGLNGLGYALAVDYDRARGFSTVFEGTIGTSTNDDEAFDIALSDDGAIWIAGTASVNTSPTAALVRGTEGGGFCDFPGADFVGGFGRAVAAGSADVFLFAGGSAGVAVSRYIQADCSCAVCSPAATGAPIEFEGEATSVNAALAVGDSVVFSGWVGPSIPEFRALLASVDAAGNPEAMVVRDLTGDGDAFQELGTDGSLVYAAGVTEAEGLGLLDQGSAVIEVYALPLVDDAAPERSFATAQVSNVVGITVAPEGEDGFFVAGAKDGGAFVIRCDKVDGCD